MIIDDLSCLKTIAYSQKIVGGQQKISFDNKALASSLAYAYGSNASAISGTSVFLDRGVSRAQGFSASQSSQ